MAFESITTNAVSVLQVFVSWNAFWTLLIVSFLLTLLSTLIYKWTTDQKKIKEIKDEQKLIQQEMKSLSNNPSKMIEKQKEMMEKSMYLMKSSFKPLIYTFVPFLIIFFLLRTAYDPLGKIMFGLTWFWIYLISSFVFSLIVRKLMKVY